MKISFITMAVASAATKSNKIKGALIDLSGTIHIGDNAIPGAIEACVSLQSTGIPVRFLTNTSKTSSSSLLAQLRRIGFDESAIPDVSSIMTSTSAARELLIAHQMKPLCLVEDILMEDLHGVDLHGNNESKNCVLVGLAPNALRYDRLNEAFRLLMRIKQEGDSDAKGKMQVKNWGKSEGRTSQSESIENTCSPLIAIHRGKYFRDSDGELSLGPGGFVSCLEETTGIKANVVGKPSREFFESALKTMGVEAHEAVMVGDDAAQDIGGARAAGIGTAILVKTGKYLVGDEKKASAPDMAPSLVVDSIVQAVDYICGHT